MRSYVPRGAVGVAMLGAVAAVVATSSPAGPVEAGTVTHSKVVSEHPISNTPDIGDGAVWDVAHVGPNKYVAVGSFTSVTEKGTGTVLSRHHAVLFNSSTGHVYRSFAPDVDDDVRAVWPSSDGDSVFIGGAFSHVNGLDRKRLARVNIATGGNTKGFHPPALNGDVRDLTVANDMLIVGGLFKKVGTKSQTALTALKRSTGSTLGFFNDIHISGTHDGRGSTQIFDMESQPSGNHLVFVGNFGSVNGHGRNQIAMLTTGGGRSRASLTNWSLPTFAKTCDASIETPVRDVAYGPAGHYIVVVSSGGKASGTYCDAAARFSADARGSHGATWVNYTGGDTLTAVEITGVAVYVGGHMRWMHNKDGNDNAGPGAIARKGLAALKTDTGATLSWNPGRERGVGVRVLRAEKSGLWVGDDTCTVGYTPNTVQRCRVKAFPLN